jgi:uncharacterized protein
MALSEETTLGKKESPLGYGPFSAILVTIGGYVGSDIIAGLTLSLLPLLTGWSTRQLQSWLNNSVLAQFLAVLLVVGALGLILVNFLRSRKVSWVRLGLKPPQGRDVKYALLGYVVYFAAFVIISEFVSSFVPGLNPDQEQEIVFNRTTTGPALGLIFMSLVILPAFFEEILFRGFLYTGLRTKWPKVAAALVASGLFAIAHLQLGSGNALLWIAALDTLILSLILIFIREKTDSLAGPIMVHFMKNGLAFVFLFVLKM